MQEVPQPMIDMNESGDRAGAIRSRLPADASGGASRVPQPEGWRRETANDPVEDAGAEDAGGPAGERVPARTSCDKHSIAILRHGLEACDAHEIATLDLAARYLGKVLGLPCAKERATEHSAGECYCIPVSTLLRGDADMHGISVEQDLWGGIVPHPFVATKLVSHPLWPSAAEPPEGWVELPGIAACTLPGYSVFTRIDALEAGRSLLQSGGIRIKSPYDSAGHGQWVVHDDEALARVLSSVPDESMAMGLVIERHLVRSRTLSLGYSRLPGLEISYCGRQRTTTDHAGGEVYGGSMLNVFNGPPEAMLKEAVCEGMQSSFEAWSRYDDLIRQNYGVIASRCNYDVIEGVDSSGRHHVGVLEQSWRFGGASMAEVLAMERFVERPRLRWTTAETVEVYGTADIPGDAVVSWEGDEPNTPVKYARILRDGRRS